MKKTKQSDQPPQWIEHADNVANALDADVIMFSGGLYPPADYNLMGLITGQRRKNVLLMLTTFGGSGESAYRIAHHLQRAYSEGEFILYVPLMCKSAGTLIAVGAHQIVMTDTAELGPLDVQILKPDEVGERHSGLTPSQTLNTLKIESFKLFEHTFNRLRERFRFPSKMAAHIAADISIGLLTPIYRQIDPMRLGEIERAMLVAGEYGARIKTENLKDDAITKLLTDYPSHGFVIDRDEANKLFWDVREPTLDELKLLSSAFPEVKEGQTREQSGDSARVLLLSTPLVSPADQKTGDTSNDSPRSSPATVPGSTSESTEPRGEGCEVDGKAQPEQRREPAPAAEFGNGSAS